MKKNINNKIINKDTIKLNISKYLKEVSLAFKPSPLTYSKINKITYKLYLLSEKANNLVKENKIEEALALYKVLLEKCMEELNYLDDPEGEIACFIFNLFDPYSSILSQVNFDKKEFLKETINLYLNDDMGFSNQIIKLMLKFNKIDNIELELLIKKEFKNRISNYEKDKLLHILLELYDLRGEFNRFLETCQLYSNQSWEGWTKAAYQYEKKGQIKRAFHFLKEGLKKNNLYKSFFIKEINKLKKSYPSLIEPIISKKK